MRNSRFAVMMLGVMLLTAGCTGGESDPQLRTGKIDIVSERTVNESGFHIEGTVMFELYLEETETFDHVMFCLYDRDGTVLASEDLGTFASSSDSASFSLRSQVVPAYITVDHPDFRNYDRFSPETFALIEDGGDPSYAHRAAYLEEIQDEFPYPRNDMQGQCG